MTALAAAVLLVITDWRKASVPLTEGLERNPYGGGSRTERLIAETENKEKTEIDVEVKEQLYTTEETKALFDKCIRQLDRLILGENKSLDYVTSDMKLVTQIPEVPVEVEWELSRYDVMNIYGEIQEDMLKEEGIQITLKAVLTYMEDRTMQAQYECMANIYPAANKGGNTGDQNKRSHSEGAGKIKDRKKTEASCHCGRRKCQLLSADGGSGTDCDRNDRSKCDIILCVR